MADAFEAPPFAGARHEHFKNAAKINADGSVFYEDGRDVDIEAEELALRRRHRAPHSLSSTSWPSWRQHPLCIALRGTRLSLRRRLKRDEISDERRAFPATAWPLLASREGLADRQVLCSRPTAPRSKRLKTATTPSRSVTRGRTKRTWSSAVPDALPSATSPLCTIVTCHETSSSSHNSSTSSRLPPCPPRPCPECLGTNPPPTGWPPHTPRDSRALTLLQVSHRLVATVRAY